FLIFPTPVISNGVRRPPLSNFHEIRDYAHANQLPSVMSKSVSYPFDEDCCPEVLGSVELHGWTGWRELGNPIVPINDVVQRVSTWPKLDAVHLMSMIDLMMEQSNHDPHVQLELLYVVNPQWTQNRTLVQAIRSGNTILFHPQVRFAMMQLILAYSDESNTEIHAIPDKAMWVDMLTGLLQLSDHINAPGPTRDDLKTYLLQTAPFTWMYEPVENQLLRSYELFAELLMGLPQQPNKHHQPIDFDNFSKKTFGVTVRELYAQIFGLYAHLASMVKVTPKGLAHIPHQAFIGTAILDQNPDLRKVLDALSKSPEELRDVLRSKPVGDLLWYSRHLAASPILRTTEGVYFILNCRLLFERLGRGMYYTLLNALPEELRPHYLTHLGRVFEKWLKDKLLEVCPDRSRLFLEDDFPELAKGPKSFRPSEAILVYPEANILWEAKSKRVVVDAYETGDLEIFRSDLGKGVQEGINQAYKVATRIHKGQFLPQRVTDICLPVIVTLDVYPVYSLLGEELQQLSEKRPPYVLPHIVIDSGSFYSLCQYVKEHGLNMLYELRQWHKAWQESGYLLTMNEFLLSKYGPIQPPDTLRRILDQIQEDSVRLYGFKS
ncbi:MAG: hypothetical protein K6T34_11345, partial [Thermoflavifilum sp.]|nr:hypothetical protein [Thermoflavifilum sp.]